MNVNLNTAETLRDYPNTDYREWIRRRSIFYECPPEKVELFRPSDLISIYERKFRDWAGSVKYANIVLRRGTIVGLLAICVDKTG
jgi:hypothetical protein